jgi:hypothetical protein
MDLRAPVFFLAKFLWGGRAAGARGADGPPSLARNRGSLPQAGPRVRPC